MSTILIMDDDPTLREYACLVLRRAGHHVLGADNGRSGLDLLKTHAVDLIITDIFMPDMDGLEVIRAARETGFGRPILAISGGGRIHNMSLLRHAAALGADQAMEKPILADVLVARVAEMLARGADAG